MSATTKWMQKVTRNIVPPGKAGPTTVAEDDEDGNQVQEMRSIALNILANKQKVKRARLRASKLVWKSSSREEGQREGEARESADSRR